MKSAGEALLTKARFLMAEKKTDQALAMAKAAVAKEWTGWPAKI